MRHFAGTSLDLLLLLVTGLGQKILLSKRRITGFTDPTAGAGCEDGEKMALNLGALLTLFEERLIFLGCFFVVATETAVFLILGLRPVEPLAAMYLMVLVDEILFFLSLETV